MAPLLTALASALAVLAVLAGPVSADTRLAATVDRTQVFANTRENTPTIFELWPSSTPCPQKVTLDTDYDPLEARWASVALPCNFSPSAGSDAPAVVEQYGGKTFESWLTKYVSGSGWHARWGGYDLRSNFVSTPYGRVWPKGPEGASYGVQASGLAFTPGVITVNDLRSGKIAHPIHINVPRSCTSWVWPATRTDWGAVPTGTDDCYQYGTAYRLPASYVVPTTGKTLLRRISQAAKDYGLVVTDQNFFGVGFRFENWKRSWASWAPGAAQVNPYDDPIGAPQYNFFQCPSTGWTWSCYFDDNLGNLAYPLGVPQAGNAESFWKSLVQVNP